MNRVFIPIPPSTVKLFSRIVPDNDIETYLHYLDLLMLHAMSFLEYGTISDNSVGEVYSQTIADSITAKYLTDKHSMDLATTEALNYTRDSINELISTLIAINVTSGKIDIINIAGSRMIGTVVGKRAIYVEDRKH